MKNTVILSLLLICCAALLAGLAGCNSNAPATTTTTSAITTSAITTSAITTSATKTSTTTTSTTTPPAQSQTTTAASSPETRIIKDMYGTELTIPAKINRVLSGGPVETQIIYILAPEKLCGVNGTGTTSFWNTGWNGTAPYIPEKYRSIPNIGNGSSNTLSFEEAIATKPDIVLEGKTKNLATYREKFGKIPVIGVNAGDDLCTMFEDEIKFVGDILGVPEKAKELIAYYQEAMNYVKKVTASLTDNDKVRVYYAQGKDGLQTDAQGSWHTNLMMFCGAYNVAKVNVQNTAQAVDVSQEQIAGWNEEKAIDMIIIGRSSQLATFSSITDQSTWWYKTLPCVEKGKVYVRPDNPISWFDGPPGYGQIVGMYWMVHLLYPEKTTDLDLNAKIKEFYSKFLHYELTDADVTKLLSQPK